MKEIKELEAAAAASEQRGEYAAAVDIYDRIIRDYDVVVAAYSARERRAMLYYQIGETDQALGELERLSREVAGTATVHAGLASLLYWCVSRLRPVSWRYRHRLLPPLPFAVSGRPVSARRNSNGTLRWTSSRTLGSPTMPGMLRAGRPGWSRPWAASWSSNRQKATEWEGSNRYNLIKPSDKRGAERPVTGYRAGHTAAC